MINFKALALTTIIALGGIAGGNAVKAEDSLFPPCMEVEWNDPSPCSNRGYYWENHVAWMSDATGEEGIPLPNRPVAPAPTYTYGLATFGFSATDVHTVGTECFSTQSYLSTNDNGTVNCY